MTKIAIEPNASGTGTFTIAAPNSNTNRTFTLPDATGEVLTDQSDLAAAQLTGDVAAARITDALNAGGSAPIYACRAWVNFNGANGSVRASGNVSSVSRLGVGRYQVNFTSAMPNANYSFLMAASNDGSIAGQSLGFAYGSWLYRPFSYSTTSMTFEIGYPANNSSFDQSHVNVSIFC